MRCIHRDLHTYFPVQLLKIEYYVQTTPLLLTMKLYILILASTLKYAKMQKTNSGANAFSQHCIVKFVYMYIYVHAYSRKQKYVFFLKKNK